MAVIVACALLVAAGVVLVVRTPAEGEAGPPPRGVWGWLRYVGVAIGAGALAGVLAAGAGGRLVMRLLGATSPEAEGSFTEAEARVGEISADGTLGLVVFAGIPAGVLSGLLYALLRPVLPRGRAGGLALGALLLVLVATRVDPLRADNFDFAFLGPGWLAVAAFGAVALLQGLLTAALAERRWRGRLPEPGPRAVTVARVAVGVLVLAALPGFVDAIDHILSAELGG